MTGSPKLEMPDSLLSKVQLWVRASAVMPSLLNHHSPSQEFTLKNKQKKKTVWALTQSKQIQMPAQPLSVPP